MFGEVRFVYVKLDKVRLGKAWLIKKKVGLRLVR
jgi:hypothetical protein